jgi:hypothetical protein
MHSFGGGRKERRSKLGALAIYEGKELVTEVHGCTFALRTNDRTGGWIERHEICIEQ